MLILLLRHGVALSAGEARGVPGDSLPLTEEGRQQIADVARGLAAMGLRLSTVLTSPLLRAVQTAEIVSATVPFEGQAVKVQALDGSIPPADTMDKVRHLLDDDTSLLVGHAPFMGRLAAWLLTGMEADFLPFQKGQVAALECREGLRPGKAVLLWTLWPEHMALIPPGGSGA